MKELTRIFKTWKQTGGSLHNTNQDAEQHNIS